MSAPTIDRLLSYDVVLLARSQDGPADEYGNPTWTELETATRGELQPAVATELLDGAVQVVTWRLFLPAGAPLRGWDAIRLADGRVLELVGDAFVARSPLTGHEHVEANLKGAE